MCIYALRAKHLKRAGRGGESLAWPAGGSERLFVRAGSNIVRAKPRKRRPILAIAQAHVEHFNISRKPLRSTSPQSPEPCRRRNREVINTGVRRNIKPSRQHPPRCLKSNREYHRAQHRRKKMYTMLCLMVGIRRPSSNENNPRRVF